MDCVSLRNGRDCLYTKVEPLPENFPLYGIRLVLIQGNLVVTLQTHLALVVCMLRSQESSPRLPFPFPTSPVVCPAYSGRG
jgi:hypothetical protein